MTSLYLFLIYNIAMTAAIKGAVGALLTAVGAVMTFKAPFFTIKIGGLIAFVIGVILLSTMLCSYQSTISKMTFGKLGFRNIQYEGEPLTKCPFRFSSDDYVGQPKKNDVALKDENCQYAPLSCERSFSEHCKSLMVGRAGERTDGPTISSK